MSLNDLPDNCLWKILENVHGVKELIQLSKVCSRWSDLITLRFNRVQYLQTMDTDTEDKVDYIDANSLWINYHTNCNDDWNLIEFFPNLKIIDTALDEAFNLPEIVKNNPQIKGLIGMHTLSRCGYLENIEMCATRFNFDYKKVFRPDQLKQVSALWLKMKDLPSFIEYFPNLKRLNLHLIANYYFYNGPNLSSLKILELCTNCFAGKFNGFYFMDFCPSLESAFFQCWSYDIHVDESIKNYNLRDLVINNAGFIHVVRNSSELSWPLLKKLLSKFPNLHHLAIRHFDVSNSDLEELIKLLTELDILDLRKCKKVTQKSADLLFKYCVKENRSIAIYYDCENEPVEWPELDTTQESIVHGFDFMKHCFYKSTIYCVPFLIDE
ncbi:uncharacterized protein LOC128388974 isoform X2 [Panonychus citri]|uniref:uncharacterized protein LOC128388974 isoform X2 n=1 Tax=Panonychus citri TaxID=50023 RepID=UPI00230772A3|nr:uncharacterized protein LOC128388974 isoform X2 [Panonychus citri]